jgi:hypothetical protein
MELDAELKEVILELNNLGAYTIGCCSGHQSNNWNGYIRFSRKCPIELAKNFYSRLYAATKDTKNKTKFEIRNRTIYFVPDQECRERFFSILKTILEGMWQTQIQVKS